MRLLVEGLAGARQLAGSPQELDRPRQGTAWAGAAAASRAILALATVLLLASGLIASKGFPAPASPKPTRGTITIGKACNGFKSICLRANRQATSAPSLLGSEQLSGSLLEATIFRGPNRVDSHRTACADTSTHRRPDSARARPALDPGAGQAVAVLSGLAAGNRPFPATSPPSYCLRARRVRRADDSELVAFPATSVKRAQRAGQVGLGCRRVGLPPVPVDHRVQSADGGLAVGADAGGDRDERRLHHRGEAGGDHLAVGGDQVEAAFAGQGPREHRLAAVSAVAVEVRRCQPV